MNDQSGKEIDRTNPQDHANPHREMIVPEMDLKAAHAILQGIVDFKEETLTETSPLDQIGEYSMEQVRQAMRLVGNNLLSRYKEHKDRQDIGYDGNINLNKLGKWPDKKRIFLSFGYEPSPPEGHELIRISLENKQKEEDLIRFDYPLKNPRDRYELFSNAGFFRYWSHGKSKQVRSSHLFDNFNIDDYRFMLRGLRWLSANMLTWGDKGLIMPEQLGNLAQAKKSSLFPKLFRK